MRSSILLGVSLPLALAKVTYEGYKAFHVDTADAYDGVLETLTDIKYVSLSCESDHKGLDIAVAPESLDQFESFGFNTTIISEDLAAEFALEGEQEAYKETLKPRDALAAAALPDISYFNSYHVFDDHMKFLTDLQASFPSNSEIINIGTSTEGRAIRGIHLWGSGGKGSKPAIVWHATVHAREWITAPTVEYMTYKIVQGYQSGDALVTSTLNNYDVYVLPVVNPDGFVYTSTNDRLWRKNRLTRSGQSCVGTDVNRNWPYKWDVPGGSSTNPCDETYRGLAAGDTVENKALVAHLQSLQRGRGIKFYVDWHSYSQLILTPYGYSCDAVDPDLTRQQKLAGGMSSAIRAVNGLSFTYGPTCKTIYQATGGSLDWVYDVAGADVSWSIELRPRSGTNNGFVVAASNIVPSGEENWAGVKYVFANF